MPRLIADETKQRAVGILHLHDDISLTHYVTGVHRRTLRRWREELRDRQNRFVSEKTFNSDINRTQTLKSDTNGLSADPAGAASDDAVAATDFENLTHIRAKLMSYARQVADDLSPDQSDANRRTLALSRVLDRIQLLDETLPQLQPKPPPPWQEAYDALLELDLEPWDLTRIQKAAESVDENHRALVYERFAKSRRKMQKRNRSR